MEPTSQPLENGQEPPAPKGPALLMSMWIALGILSLGLATRGVMMVLGGREAESKMHPGNRPTTGPFTSEELFAAEGLVREALALSEGKVVIPTTQQIESVAENQRLMEEGRQRVNSSRAVAAINRGVIGWCLVGTGVVLAAVFTWAARMTWARGKA